MQFAVIFAGMRGSIDWRIIKSFKLTVHTIVGEK
jgi:hypothetical protein